MSVHELIYYTLINKKTSDRGNRNILIIGRKNNCVSRSLLFRLKSLTLVLVLKRLKLIIIFRLQLQSHHVFPKGDAYLLGCLLSSLTMFSTFPEMYIFVICRDRKLFKFIKNTLDCEHFKKRFRQLIAFMIFQCM